jgi:DNA-directed RNA polymerase subunit RPC12/RpoP
MTWLRKCYWCKKDTKSLHNRGRVQCKDCTFLPLAKRPDIRTKKWAKQKAQIALDASLV